MSATGERIIAVGRGVLELTGYGGAATCSGDPSHALALSDTPPLGVAREWQGAPPRPAAELGTRAGSWKPITADFFPAYHDEGERCVVVGWPLAEDGRSCLAGTALLGESGEPLAVGRQVWIVPRSTNEA